MPSSTGDRITSTPGSVVWVVAAKSSVSRVRPPTAALSVSFRTLLMPPPSFTACPPKDTETDSPLRAMKAVPSALKPMAQVSL